MTRWEWIERGVFFIVALVYIVFICTFSNAQEGLGPKKKLQYLPLERVFVREITITGNTVFSAEELAEITAPYLSRDLSPEDLEDLRRALTLYYINKGYINSGAIIPGQTVTNGVLTLQVIEGELTHMKVEGVKWFNARYIKDRLSLGAGPPLNIIPLQERLQLLQQDPRIQRLNAELKPGVKPGESELNVQVEEESPYKLWLRFNNYQSPTVGAERGQVTVAHQNMTGHGDILSLTYGRSEGIDTQIDAMYSVPFTAHDTTVNLRYRKNDFAVIEEPFEPLDVESKSEIFTVTLRHPFYRTTSQEFAMALTGEHLHNETFLLGEPFPFSLGAENGDSKVTALRFSQEWTYRTQTQVFAIHSRFSLGIDALDATINEPGIPDSRFFSWLGQFQWARRLRLWDIQMIFRTDLQLANDPLLPLEQIAIGGRFSVRGYRENQMVRDNGLISSLEFRIPLIRNKFWADSVQLALFVDFGRAWNKDISTPELKNISSAGLGLRWEVTLPLRLQLKPQFEIYWGVPFRDIETSGGDLQDHGIHVQITITAF